MDPTVLELISQLTIIAGRNVTSAISERIKTVRASRKSEEVVSSLEDIINELLDDKAQLTRVAQGLRDQLVAQQISEEDITFIVNTLVPAIEQIAETTGQPLPENILNAVKTLLEPEMFKVLQLLGFDFRNAIGKPLTDLLQKVILQSEEEKGSNNALQLAGLRNQTTVAEVSKDPEAFKRFRSLFPSVEDRS